MDMMKSLGMSEMLRSIYWKAIFGHRKGSEWFGHFFGVPGGYRNPPGEVMGLIGHKKEAHQPTRGWCAPLGQEAE